MIGWSVAHGQSRIALKAADDTVRLTATELPHTRSEAAIPLRSRGQTLGALTVQDSRPDAFDQDTIAVLQTMADQVAVALDNARLFAQSEQALAAERRTFGELQYQGWVQLLRERPGLGFRSDAHGISPAATLWPPEMDQAAQTGELIQKRIVDQAAGDGNVRQTLTVPIKIRGEVVAVLDTYKPTRAGDWTDEEVGLLEAVTDQLGLALENARLYENTQARAERERTVRDITAQLRAAGDVDSILRTAVHEIRRALRTTHGVIRLGTETHLVSPGAVVGSLPDGSAQIEEENEE
jgi:GAF domain-containing protein